MGTLSTYAINALMDQIFNDGTRPTSWANIWLCLCTATPAIGDTGATMDELSAAGANGYTRMAIDFNNASGRKVVQATDVTFPQAGADWPQVTHWAIVDGPDNTPQAATNLLAFGSFTSPFTTLQYNSAKVTAATSPVEVEIQATATGAGFTDYAVHQMLNLMFNYTDWTVAGVYVGLTTATLTDSTTSPTEVSTTGTNYARELVSENLGVSPYWTAASAGAVNNVQDIIMGPPTGTNWGTVTSMILCDALTGGNILAYDNTNIADQAINAGDTVTFTATNLSVTLS